MLPVDRRSMFLLACARMSVVRRVSGCLGVAILLFGCETLEARRVAKEGADLYAKGDFAAAAQKYEEATRLDPSLSVLDLNLGFTYLQLLRGAPKAEQDALSRKAVEALSRYRDRKPDDPRGRDYLLQTFVDTLRYDDAQAFFKPELERDPPSLEAITVLGQIAAKLGNLEEAMKWCQRRADVRPDDPAGYQCLGSLLWNHLHKHPEIAGPSRIEFADRGLHALGRAVELDPEAPEPYTFMNLIHRQRALAHPCGVGFDAGLDDRGKPVDAGIDEVACEAAKAADLAAADKFQGMAKERAAAKPKPDGGP